MFVISFFSMQAAVKIPKTPSEIAEYLQAVETYISQPTVPHADWAGYQLMIAAIHAQLIQPVEQLLKKGLSPNGLYACHYSFLRSALEQCNCFKHKQYKEILNKEGYPVSTIDMTFYPSDDLLQRRIVKILLAHGAFLHDAEGNGFTQHQLVQAQDLVLAEFKIDCKAQELIPAVVAVQNRAAGKVPVSELLAKMLGQLNYSTYLRL